MLQHEPTPEVLHQPFTSNYPSSLTEQETEGMTPQELAQAIVAVEERQGTPLQEEAGSPVIQQTIDKSGLAITPDSLLAEVHRQRAQSHQNSAMTPHLTQNLSVRLLIAGLIFSSIVALLLLATNVVFINRFSVANEALAKYDSLASQKTSSPNALQRLQSWKYPGASSFGSSQGTNMASATLRTNDDYAKVWKFYAEQSGFSNATNINGTQNLSASGSIIQNGQSVQYEIHSTSGPAEQSAIFTQIGPFHTVTMALSHHMGDPDTAMHIVVATLR